MSVLMLISSLTYVLLVGGTLRTFLRRRECFAPEVLVSASFLLPVPYLFVVSFWPEKADLLGYFTHSAYQSTFAIVVVLQVFLCFTVILGILFARMLLKRRNSELKSGLAFKSQGREIRSNVPGLISGIAMLVAGFILIMYIVIAKGEGVAALWSYIGARTDVLSGSGGEYLLGRILVVVGMSVVFLQTYCRRRYRMVFIGSLGVAVFSLGVFGARGPVINMIILLVVVYHYYVSQLTISVKTFLKFLPLGMAIIAFVAVIAAVRKFQMQELSGSGGVLDLVDVTFEAASHMSHINTYMFIFDYFNYSNIWLGASYLNLLYFTGVLDHVGKVALDDGVYVLALIMTGNVNPNEILGNMFASSSPPGLWFGFMQFHFLGLFLFAFLVGVVKGIFYKNFLSSGKSLYAFFLMFEVAYSFQPTVFWIFTCVVATIVYSALFGIMQIFPKRKTNFACHIGYSSRQ
jgi:hypothetical protein